MKSYYNETSIPSVQQNGFRFFSPKYFANLFKRNWAQTLLFGIVQFFAISVYFALYMNGISSPTNYYEKACDFFIHDSYPTVLIVMLGAIFSALSATNYLNTRRNANFIHSLPLHRESLYFSGYANGALTFLFPFTVNTLFLTGAVFISGLLEGSIPQIIVVYYFKYFMWFMLFYAITYVVSMAVSGNIVRFLLTIAAIYYVPAMYMFMIGFVQESSYNIYTNYYSSNKIIGTLSPGVRIFTELASENFYLKASEYLLCIASTVVLTLLGLWIYLRRRNENTEKTVIFPVLGQVLKFIVMVPLTIAAGFAFYYLSDSSSPVWTVFGLICGAVLSFMLINCILTKNVGEMFKKPIGLVIYCAVFGVLLGGASFAVGKLDAALPNSSAVKYVEVELDNMPTVIYTEDSEIDALNAILSGSQDIANRYVPLASKLESVLSDKFYSDDGTSSPSLVTIDMRDKAISESYSNNIYFYDTSFSIEVRYKLNFGFVLSKRYYIQEAPQFKDELRVLLDSSAFKDMFTEVVSNIEPSSIRINRIYYDEYSTNSDKPVYSIPPFVSGSIKAGAGYDYFQNTTIGRTSGSTKINDSQLYLGLPIFYQHIVEFYPDLVDDYIPDEDLIAKIEKIEVYRADDLTTPHAVFTEAEQVLELIKCGTTIPGTSPNPLTIKDDDYCMAVYTIEYYENDVSENNIYLIPFLDGKVPALAK